MGRKTMTGPLSSARSRWLLLLLVAAAVVTVVLVTTRWLADRPDPAPTLPRSAHVETFYLGGSPAKAWLYQERHTVTGASTQVEAAVNEALGSPLDPDYGSGFPDGTSARVSVEGGVATVDLRGTDIEADPARAGRFDGALAMQAVVHTVVANSDGVRTVRFLVAGQAPTTLLGVRVDGPLTPAAGARVLSPVRLDLDEGALLQARAQVTGTASAFEGTVLWQVTGRSGAVIEEGHTTTQECCRPMPFTIELPDLPAGTYVLTVAESDPSGGEGFPPAEDSKTFTLG